MPEATVGNTEPHYVKCGEAFVNKLAANLVCLLVAALISGVLLPIYLFLPHSYRLDEHDLLKYLFSVIPFIIMHEVIHAATAVYIGGVQWKDLNFGFNWKAMMPFYHVKVLLTVKACRVIVLAPLFITGPLSLAIFFAVPTTWSTFLAVTALSGCTGDIWLFLKLRRFANNTLAKDHPSEIGCEIFEAVNGAPLTPPPFQTSRPSPPSGP